MLLQLSAERCAEIVSWPLNVLIDNLQKDKVKATEALEAYQKQVKHTMICNIWHLDFVYVTNKEVNWATIIWYCATSYVHITKIYPSP